VKLTAFDADYVVEDGEVTVRVFGRNSSGVHMLKDSDFKPYFYAVPEESIEEVKEEIKGVEFESDNGRELNVLEIESAKLKDGNESLQVLRIFTNIPANVPHLKNSFWDLESVKECREFDVPFYRRYLIDKAIRPGQNVEVSGDVTDSEDFESVIQVDKIKPVSGESEWSEMSFDLEVIDDTIVMASFFSNDFAKVLSLKESELEFVESVENEEALLKRFIEILEERDIDILTGYNTDEFDFQILREAAERNKIELALGRNGERMKFNRRGRFAGARIKARMHLDLYPFITHIMAPGIDSETLDLDSVAGELLGMEKDHLEWDEMKEIWRNNGDIDKFARYALKDAEITYKLGREITPQILELSKITGLIPFDTCRMTYGQLTENYLLREAYHRDILAENRPSQSKRQKRDREQAYKGGFVYTPEPGLYEDVAVFDFRSLYPTVMVAHNISPDTLDLENCDDEFDVEELGYSFCQDSQGFFPQLVEDLVSSRYKIKKQMKDAEGVELKSLDNRQQAQKILANSFYGYLGYSGARWYSRESAEATTFLGRKYIQDTVELAEEMGFEMAYGDTDSIMVRKDDLEDYLDELLQVVNSELPDFMELEFEGLFKRGFFTSKESGEGAKKKYALMGHDKSMKITGFEQVRRDWSPIAKDTQEKVLRKVLEADVEGAVELVKEKVQALKSGEIPVEELKIYTTLTKPPEEYHSTAPHVEAAKKAMKRGDDIPPETTIDYVVTSNGGTISEKAEITKYADSYDADYYIDNQLIPVSLRVLKVFDYTENQLKGKGRQSGLDRFN